METRLRKFAARKGVSYFSVIAGTLGDPRYVKALTHLDSGWHGTPEGSTAGTSLKYDWAISPQATLGHYRTMKRTVIWLTERQRKALTLLSKKTLAPVSALVRHAVDEFLRKRGKPHRAPLTRR